MAACTDLDFRLGLPLAPADLLDLYHQRPLSNLLLLKAVQAAARFERPGPDLPWTFKERREAVYAALYRGETSDADSLACGWLEATMESGAALEMVAALEAVSIVFQTRGEATHAAIALAAAIRLHQRRSQLPFHGTLLRRAVGVLGCLGGIDAARLLAADALRLAIETGDDAGAAFSLGAVHRMANLAGDLPAMLSSVLAAKRYLPPDSDYSLVFSLLLGEANALTRLGRLDEAEDALAAATAALAGHETPLTESFLRWNEGHLRQAQGRHQEAATAFALAAEQGRATQEPVNRVMLLLDLAESLEALGRTAELRERCARLAEELPSLASLEGGSVVAGAFAQLCAKVAGPKAA